MISCYWVVCALSAPQFGTLIFSAHAEGSLTARVTGFRVIILMMLLLTDKLPGEAYRKRSLRPCRGLFTARRQHKPTGEHQQDLVMCPDR